MTIAIALALSKLKGNYEEDVVKDVTKECMLLLGREYSHCGYGTGFYQWLFEDSKPYYSLGNGAAMRISSVGYFAKTEKEVKLLSKIITELSHNHPEAVTGAEATAMATFLAKEGWFKQDICDMIASEYYPEIKDMTCDNIRKDYYYTCSCKETVPQALTCFFESIDFEDAIRNAVSLGGDSDTVAAIAGGVAGAYYGIPWWIKETAWQFLDDRLKEIVLGIISNKFA